MPNFRIEGPVFPIPPDYTDDGEDLELSTTELYLKYLFECGAKYIMTTAGTSQYNLLSRDEIRRFNMSLVKSEFEQIILGIQQLSTEHLLEEIGYYNDSLSSTDKDIVLMVLYPERYYDDDSIISFYKEISDKSSFPIYIHCMPMRRANGGTYEYTSEIVNRINEETSGVVCGLKEESSSFDKGYEFVKDINTENVNVIVAGKSQRRYLSLYPAGAQSFLSGVGSFIPSVDISFYELYVNSPINEKRHLGILKLEDYLFDNFMKIGWHVAMRQTLKLMEMTCKNNRRPFSNITEEHKEVIEQTIAMMMVKIKETLGE